MGGHLLRRLLAAFVTALLSSLAVFLLVRAVPGDIVAQMLGQAGGDPATEQALRGFFGLDRPVWQQYLAWLGQVLQGDLGTSWTQGLPVAGIVGQAFAVTLELGLLTLIVATAIGVPMGLVAGIHEGRLLDNVIQGINILGLAAPVFWIGLMLLIGASALIGWSPPFMYSSPGQDLWQNLQILLLPILSLGLLQAVAYSQFVRQSVVSALQQDYVRTAIAKGLPQRKVFFKHILRNILIPLVTFMGLILVQILGGVVVIESLFALPGLGRLLLTSIQNRDLPVVQGGLLLVVGVALSLNILIDMLYQYLDPRMRR
ncbi:ABC transporter permease [Marinimicrococcus flavescens]|uniref:ABC transporter permease n=1 Tax=Marinimicrococcus flavescens TaxID=3031815 RepID=A0AAP3UZ54_9PROT|nr:ABC transporter permease [Marinimicrococcus flavescens]